MANAVRRYQRTGAGFKERLIVKTFKYRDDMWKFLATGSNALVWREIDALSPMPLSAGTYVFAGGLWRNVKSIDASALAHM